LRDFLFLSPKAINIIARRESPGQALKNIPFLKATNNYATNVARLQRASVLAAINPAILAGLYCWSPLATKTGISTRVKTVEFQVMTIHKAFL
jgi:hypothetical protein